MNWTDDKILEHNMKTLLFDTNVYAVYGVVHTSKVILSPGIPVNVHECLGLSHYRSGHALGDVSTNLFVHSLPPLHAHITHTHIHTHTHT